MERLTKRLSSGAPTYNYPASCYFDDNSGPDRIAQSAFRQRCVERLSEYEDTRLEPEEVLPKDKADEIALKLMRLADLESLCSYTRLRELAEADKNGRLVVLPCKVGDTVWAVSGKIIKCEIEETYLYDGGGIEYFVTFDCDGADCKGCPFNRWEQDCSGERYCECEYGCSSFKDSDIGKTVFLTHEEAEAALEAKRDG